MLNLEYRRVAVRYRERRRIIYNLVVAFLSYFSFEFQDALNNVGDPHERDWSFLLLSFAQMLIGANICYTFAYALEFFFGTDDPRSDWMIFGRSWSFVAGLMLALFLALSAGASIANSEWDHSHSYDPDL